MEKYVYDTNALLLYSHLLSLDGVKIIPYVVLKELDRLKVGFNETAFNAREAVRKLKSLNNIIYDHRFEKPSDDKINDDIIVDCAKENDAVLITGDFLVQLKAKSLGLDVYNLNSDDEDYLGYKDMILNEEQIAAIYENLDINTYNLLLNEYIVIKNKYEEIVDTLYWDGQRHQYAHHKGLSTNMFGKFKPFDAYQVCALESLSRNQMTMLKGLAGSGKSLIALNYSWSQIEKGKYDKLVVFANPVNARGSTKLGFYPGSRIEKLMNSTLGSMLASKFGDAMQVEMLIQQGKVELLPFADIRGWDSTGMRAIVYFSESQNLDVELMRLGISRCGNDSKVILDGDYNSQVDSDLFAGLNNGMRRVSEIFRGREFYGEVFLPKVYRSKMAEIAQLL